MAIGFGYGSEFHLLRFLGRHRDYLNYEILKKKYGKECFNYRIEWLDFDFSGNYQVIPSVNLPDQEIKGIGFLMQTAKNCDSRRLNSGLQAWDKYKDSKNIDEDKIKKEWNNYWPQTGNAQNWDAVGIILKKDFCKSDSECFTWIFEEWILIEAKAHTGEVASSCGADNKTSKKMIEEALKETATDMGVHFDEECWLEKYYQVANRLAMLNFLNKLNIPASLFLLYFCGDKNPAYYCNHCSPSNSPCVFLHKTRICPSNSNGWDSVIQEIQKCFKNINNSKNVFDLFIDVNPIRIGNSGSPGHANSSNQNASANAATVTPAATATPTPTPTSHSRPVIIRHLLSKVANPNIKSKGFAIHSPTSGSTLLQKKGKPLITIWPAKNKNDDYFYLKDMTPTEQNIVGKTPGISIKGVKAYFGRATDNDLINTIDQIVK